MRQGRVARTDHDLGHRFLVGDSTHIYIYIFPILYDLAHVAGWEPSNLNDLADVFLGWICMICMICTICMI